MNSRFSLMEDCQDCLKLSSLTAISLYREFKIYFIMFYLQFHFNCFILKNSYYLYPSHHQGILFQGLLKMNCLLFFIQYHFLIFLIQILDLNFQTNFYPCRFAIKNSFNLINLFVFIL